MQLPTLTSMNMFVDVAARCMRGRFDMPSLRLPSRFQKTLVHEVLLKLEHRESKQDGLRVSLGLWCDTHTPRHID